MTSIHARGRARRLPAVLAGLLLCTGCAAAGPAAGRPPTEGEVRALEERVASDSTRVDDLLALGRAYHLAGRPEAARAPLERALAERPDDPRAVLLLGAAYEDLGRLDEAEARYRAYIDATRGGALRGQVADRLVLLQRQRVLAAAREAVAREAELAATPPRPQTVAVFPFLIQTDDPELRPLGRALADLLVTDLSQTGRLTVLERLQVQALLDEIRLAESGLVEPATAARGGRLLGAGRVVQGSVGGDAQALQLRAAVVGVGGELEGQVSPLEESDALDRLFDMQKRLALELYRSLGVELTPAERERVLRRPTENVRALLAYGLGLEAEDAGDYALARQHFAQAAGIDPGFAAARQREVAASRAASAATGGTRRIVLQVGTGDPAAALAAAEEMVPGMGGRDAVSELLGSEGVGGRGATLRVILRQGGGSE